MSGKPQLDFDVIKEPWNKYQLISDDAILKTKLVITRIRKKVLGDNKGEYGFDMQPIVVVLSDEIGAPDSKNYTAQEIQAAIVKDDLRYDTVTEEWNEYVIDDGSRLRIKSTVTRVAKTSLFDNMGTRQYYVEFNNIAQVKMPRL
ncbi:MAG TPA: hypothetical protein VF884_15045 [Nitrososphaeraceae archaeon]